MAKFVENWKRELEGKNIDYKINYVEDLILIKKIKLESAIEIINYIFEIKQDLYKRQNKKDELYELAFHCCSSKRDMEMIDYYIKYEEKQNIFLRDIEEAEQMKQKHDKWLKQDKRRA